MLRDKAMQLQSTEESRHDAQSVAQIKDFVKKLGSPQTEKKALQVHINVAEQIGDHAKAIEFGKTVQVEQDIIRGEEANACMEYVEECSYRQVELRRLLRLACLSSLTSNGMKQKPFDALRREILQSYGYEALFTLANLETVGLFRRNGGPPGHCNNGNWSSVKRALKLFVEDDQAQVLPLSQPTHEPTHTHARLRAHTTRLPHSRPESGMQRPRPRALGLNRVLCVCRPCGRTTSATSTVATPLSRCDWCSSRWGCCRATVGGSTPRPPLSAILAGVSRVPPAWAPATAQAGAATMTSCQAGHPRRPNRSHRVGLRRQPAVARRRRKRR